MKRKVFDSYAPLYQSQYQYLIQHKNDYLFLEVACGSLMWLNSSLCHPVIIAIDAAVGCEAGESVHRL
jgi:hypothetical protein